MLKLFDAFPSGKMLCFSVKNLKKFSVMKTFRCINVECLLANRTQHFLSNFKRFFVFVGTYSFVKQFSFLFMTTKWNKLPQLNKLRLEPTITTECPYWIQLSQCHKSTSGECCDSDTENWEILRIWNFSAFSCRYNYVFPPDMEDIYDIEMFDGFRLRYSFG